MKARNLNVSSYKTRQLIRKTFAEMLCEKGEISKITVTELVKRANINRGTFYSHYDDIYAVLTDYEDELVEKFFSGFELITTDFEQFADAIFAFMERNDKLYKLLCSSNESVSFATKLTAMAEDKLLEICYTTPELTDKTFLDLEINIFCEGLIYEYFKYCRGASSVTLKDLREYISVWYRDFMRRRTKAA
ncbi:MAG: TetR/AcrR family transcriptional regulator [Clostridia bacterium]|nr:TetR/AcrR family transcriptional regulator [Clostridia bacterium]